MFSPVSLSPNPEHHSACDSALPTWRIPGIIRRLFGSRWRVDLIHDHGNIMPVDMVENVFKAFESLSSNEATSKKPDSQNKCGFGCVPRLKAALQEGGRGNNWKDACAVTQDPPFQRCPTYCWRWRIILCRNVTHSICYYTPGLDPFEKKKLSLYLTKRHQKLLTSSFKTISF